MKLRRIAVMAIIALLLPARSLAADAEPISAIGEINGQVADIHDSTQSSGFRFQVALRGLSYSGRIDRTVLERGENGSVSIWLAFRDIQLTIGRIALSGQPGSATCGPLALHVGHRREVWVAFDFDYDSSSARPLKYSGSRCGIENDNWAIGSPAWVQTSGLFMTQAKVVSGVRSGLAARRARIEWELQRIAYGVLAESCQESGEAPLDQNAFAEALATRLVKDGHLSAAAAETGEAEVPLTGFTRELPDLIRLDGTASVE